MYYKAPDDSLHSLDDSGYEYLLPAGSVAISEAEFLALQPPQPAPASTVVSPRQIRQALNQAGLRASVETAVSAGNQDLKDWWQYATSFVETHPQVVAMAQALSISDADLHSLFELASSL